MHLCPAPVYTIAMPDTYSRDIAYCRYILPKVSRSFAFNISLLRGQLHLSVLSGYLVCRILDTIEDAPHFKSKTKITLLKSFLKIFNNYSESGINTWTAKTAKLTAHPAEKELLQNSSRVLRVIQKLPPFYKNELKGPVNRMGQGMAAMLRKHSKGHKATIKDENELKKYCYYVAGTVAEFLTGVFTQKIRSPYRRRYLKLYMNDFGLALQLTNIIKDFQNDNQRNWGYIPRTWYQRFRLQQKDFFCCRYPEKNKKLLSFFIKRIIDYQLKALDYLKAIPRTRVRIRLFCAFALFLAAMTLRKISGQTHKKKIAHKVARSKVNKLIYTLPLIIFSNLLLERKLNKIINRIKITY
ncbi:MAG TPA: squalene/phytoene synthase family protein [Spirochaetota bacterium]|nr:squalene/phytoene synthase family protein [Spirochaetota bacterium]